MRLNSISLKPNVKLTRVGNKLMPNTNQDNVDWKKAAKKFLDLRPDDQTSEEAIKWRTAVVDESDNWTNTDGFSLKEFLNLASGLIQ